ncbi:hypothetical protein NC651_001189 [Populus alba x Populus x berolinensis]|nr:hypothetical protein NC651_001189 [Populus alba x Populus x berolinensis]
MVWRRALDLHGVNVCSLAAFLPSFDAVPQDQHCNHFLALEALNWLGTPN